MNTPETETNIKLGTDKPEGKTNISMGTFPAKTKHEHGTLTSPAYPVWP